MPMTETPRKTWTDERLDDLSARMDAGFARVDRDIRDLRGEMNTRFESLHVETNRRFESLQRQIWVGGVALLAAVIGTGVLT